MVLTNDENQNISKLPIEYFYEIIMTAMITKNCEVMEWIIKKVEDNREESHIFHIRHIQHYFIMKSLYYATLNDRTSFKENINLFSLETGSTSYKEVLELFILMAEYQFAEGHDKYVIKKEYKKLSEKLSYPLFDENYLILNANP